MIERRVPVTLVTGWHGAGKTALIRSLLERTTTRTAVVQNGFAAEGLDASALLVLEEEVVHLSAGCDCCAVRTDLLRALEQLAQRRRPPERILVELAADADSAIAVQTILGDPLLRDLVLVDAVVAVVDARSMAARLHTDQRAMCDQRGEDQLAIADVIWISQMETLDGSSQDLVSWTCYEHGPAALVGWQTNDAVLDLVGGLGAFELTRSNEHLVRAAHRIDRRHDGARRLLISVRGTLDETALEDWVHDLHASAGSDLLRLHGVLAMHGHEQRWHIQGVRTTLEVADGAPWHDEEVHSQLLVVGRDLDDHALQSTFAACATS